MYAQLGNIKFQGLVSPTSLEKSTEANYAQHEVIDGKARLQRVGDALDTITLEMMLHVAFCNPEVELKKFEDAKNEAEVLPYINAAGDFLGNYVIKSIIRNDQDQDKNGQIVQTELTIELLEFADPDVLQASRTKAKEIAYANEQNKLIAGQQNDASQSNVGLSTDSMNAAVAQNQEIQNQATNIENNPGDEAPFFDKMNEALVTMAEDISKAINYVNSTVGSIYTQTRTFESNLVNVANQITNLQAVSTLNDVVNTIPAAALLNTSVNSMKNSGSLVAGMVATRRY